MKSLHYLLTLSLFVSLGATGCSDGQQILEKKGQKQTDSADDNQKVPDDGTLIATGREDGHSGACLVVDLPAVEEGEE